MLNKYLWNEWIDSFLLLISVHFNSHFCHFLLLFIDIFRKLFCSKNINLLSDFFFSFSIFSTLWWSFFQTVLFTIFYGIYKYIHIYTYTYNINIFTYIMVFPFGILCYMLLCVCAVCLITQSCLTLWSLMGCSPPSFSVHGIFQTRILERIAISYSQGSSWPRDWSHISCISCISVGLLTTKATILLALKQ